MFTGWLGSRGKAVIGESASELMEGIVTELQGSHQVVEGKDRDTGDGLEFAQPGTETLVVRDLERLIGAEGREDLCGEAAAEDRAVMIERVGRIVGGAEYFHAMKSQNIMHSQPGELGIRLLPDGGGGRFIQRDVHVEMTGQLKMRPVIERIAQGVGNRPSPGLEFLLG